MHILFGERFLKLFAGDLQGPLKQSTSNVKDQNPEAKAEDDGEPVDPAFEEGREKNLAQGNHLPNVEDQNKKKDTER